MGRTSLVTNVGDADLKLLRIFKAVAESGGLSAAEAELNIGLSTISKHVADLEFRLDLKLCNRGPAGFSLTEDGENVLKAAERLLKSVSEFRAEVNEIKEEMVGTIRISLFDQSASNPESHLARSIAAFNKLAPEVEINLSIEPPNVIESMVIGGQLDVGIIAEHRVSPSLKYTPLYGENMYLFCGRDNPLFNRPQEELTLAEVRRANYAGINVNSPNLHVGQKLNFRRSAKVQSEEALTILILSGSYLGFLPDHLTYTFVRKGLVRPILPEAINYRVEFSAVTRRTPEPNRITNLFVQTLAREHGTSTEGTI